MTENNNAKALINISFIIPVVGFINRMVVKIPILGKRVLQVSNRITGWMLPKITLLGFRRGNTYEDAIWNWEIFLSLIGAQYHAEEISPDSKVYTITKCPAGYCNINHLKACEATMELDHSLVRNSGAKLIVEKRFPIDGVCLEKIVKL